ncbi:MAG TPA: hypothetical protein PKU96_05960 [bacterium]|nr:hypothetical protein [Myxococcales bacterium]OQA61216.1 MAG: hypothetical protein BWY40_00655 [bacterium ADurb.Bin270]HPW45896.1 hypothetical protein [bacterium]HQH80059.1 hypothetical protein [bacterium]
MKLKKAVSLFAVILITAIFFSGCAKDDSHWGQKLDVDKKWWKVEGQSWDRKNNLFMAVGYSNPNWSDKYDQRKSADLDARSQAASFMNSLVKNYMQETRSHNYSLSESFVEISANETVLGSVIVARKYWKKRYHSLVKVDLGYFFSNIYKKYAADMESKIKKSSQSVSAEEISARVSASVEKLKTLEVPAIEKSIVATPKAEGIDE